MSSRESRRKFLERRRLLQSSLPSPNIASAPSGESRALRVHPSQAAEANEVAQGMGCGTPFRADGMFVGNRAEKRRYMKEINRRAVDRGEDRIVNFDGGYGDET